MLMSLQALRALAAWLVVFHHFMQIFFDLRSDGPVGNFFSDKGAVGVDLFFVISGTVIYLSTQGKDIGPGRFLLNRLLRIVPAYWLYSLLAAGLILYFNPVMPTQTFELGHFLLSLLFIPAENPAGYGEFPTLYVGWTLNYEMFFYLLFSLSLLVNERFRPWLTAASLGVVSLVLARQEWVSDFYRNSIVFEFLLGLMIGVCYRRGWIVQGFWIPIALIVASLLAILHLQPYPRLLHWGLPSAVIVAACLSLEPYFRRSGLLKMLGDCSYSVYLLHVIVLSLGWYLSQRFALNPYAVLGACVPLILIAGWCSYELIEKRLMLGMKLWLASGGVVSEPLSFSRQKY